jgi:hypothetical protein
LSASPLVQLMYAGDRIVLHHHYSMQWHMPRTALSTSPQALQHAAQDRIDCITAFLQCADKGVHMVYLIALSGLFSSHGWGHIQVIHMALTARIYRAVVSLGSVQQSNLKHTSGIVICSYRSYYFQSSFLQLHRHCEWRPRWLHLWRGS